MRTHYKNGDEISLKGCGCDGCSPSMINGVLCHEKGCPEAWRDRTKECHECGREFYPKSWFQPYCEDCDQAMNSEPQFWEDEDEES